MYTGRALFILATNYLKNTAMPPVLQNLCAIIGGWLIGSGINLSLVNLGHLVFPLAGVDPQDMEALAAAIPTAEWTFFIFPFLGHALGTLAGALVAALIATVSWRMRAAMIVGALFFLGGLTVNFLLPGPLWFTVLDLVIAYIPMAWLGGKFAIRLRPVKRKFPTFFQ